MKNFLKLSFALALALTVSSCNCFKKMASDLDLVEVKCTPELLELNNGKVKATVAITFPTGYFNEKAIVKITPVIVYKGGEVAATPFYYQGVKVIDNYKVAIGAINESFEFDYTPEMAFSSLQLRAEVKCKDEFEVIDLNTGKTLSANEKAILAAGTTSIEAQVILRDCGYEIAKGVNTLQNDFKQAVIMKMMDSSYERVTNSVERADLVYTISSAQVSTKALQSSGVASFVDTVDANSQNDHATQNLSVAGYASPDGPEKFNDKLSSARSESGKRAMAKLLRKYGLTIDAASYGEDWDGFRAAVEASSIEDKNLILQVLSLYTSSTKREEEIKNLSAVYSELKSDILPQLRRSQMVNSVDLIGKSDEEIMALVATKSYDELHLLEILHVCNDLSKDCAQKLEMLTYAADKYNDGVAYNNKGVVLAKGGNAEDAIVAFKSALQNGAPKSEVSRNLTLAYLMAGNVEEAKVYSAGTDAATMSLLAAAQGKYEPAAKELEGYNKAVALVLMGSYDAASAALGKADCAHSLYLKAVIASKKGDIKVAATQIEAAVSKDKSLAVKAASDANLVNLFESGFKL